MANGASQFWVYLGKTVNVNNILAAFLASLFFQILFVYQTTGVFIGEVFYPTIIGVCVMYIILRVYENIIVVYFNAVILRNVSVSKQA